MRLAPEDLDRLARSLADLYSMLYEGRPVEARCTLNENMLAFAFRDGLTVADEWLLANGRDDRVVEFRRNFFEVVSDEMVSVVFDLVDLVVDSSFFDFDPGTRTTRAIFVVEPSVAGDAEERRAVLNWGEQVRRNARRLRAEHIANREHHVELQHEVREKRETAERRADPS
jgi:hypothetical protein